MCETLVAVCLLCGRVYNGTPSCCRVCETLYIPWGHFNTNPAYYESGDSCRGRRTVSPGCLWVGTAGDAGGEKIDSHLRSHPPRFTPDGKYVVVAQLSLSRLLLLAAPPVGRLGPCRVVSSIQLADQVSPHLLDVSAKTGAIYVAEIGAKQVQKYVPLDSHLPAFRS